MNTSQADVLDSSTNIIDNKLEYFSFFPIRLVCYVFSFTGLYLFLFGGAGGMLLGGLFFLLTFPVAIVQKRITVDLTNSQYREYLSFFGLKTGKWHSFKGFRIITITPSDKMDRMNVQYGGAESTANSTLFYLNLKKDNYNKINIAAGNYKSIFKKAVFLSHRFQMDILDCSEKPNKKLEYSFIAQTYPDTSL